ncbi:MAG: ABC transporter permease [Gemmatimonadetes bacterium]|nr:ABC transporter permease [Gemmatimonadota bacterium]
MDVSRTGGQARTGRMSTLREPPTPRRRTRLQGAFGGALVALAAAGGLVVGLRSVAALDWGGVRSLLRLPRLPHDPLGLTWSSRVIWSDLLQSVALQRMGRVILALFLAAMVVALLNTLILLLEAGSSRRREVAVRAALGAPPRSLLRLFLADVRRLLSLALPLGLLLGLSAGGVIRAAWPGPLAPLGAVGATGTVAIGLLSAAAVASVAYVWVGLALGRSDHLSAELGAGERATDDPAAIFRRRVLSSFQMGVAGSVALATVALAKAVIVPGGIASSSATTVIAVSVPAVGTGGVGNGGGTAGPATAARSWQKLLARMAAVPGVEAESLSARGALVGLGVRDYATAQCGACVRGLMPAPFWGAVADHYAVAPGYFGMIGRKVVSGRAFQASDGPSAKKVAVVNETFAYTAFEKGDPLGHLVRLGHDLDSWYEVVGVVADEAPVVVGRDDVPRAQVYVSTLQQPPMQADLLLRGDDAAVRTAMDFLAADGYRPDQPRTLEEVRRSAAAPLAWIGRVAVGLALVTLLLALQGSHATALQVTRRRLRELAVRRAMGATDVRVLLFVLGGAARGALWGAALATFLGALWVALLQKTAAGVPSPGLESYVAMAALLVAVALAASLKAAREALAVAPAEAAA